MGKTNALALVVVAACHYPTEFQLDVTHRVIVPGETVDFEIVDQCGLLNAGDCWGVGSVVAATGAIEVDGTSAIGTQRAGQGTFDVYAEYFDSLFQPPVSHGTATAAIEVALPDKVAIDAPCDDGFEGSEVPLDRDIQISWTMELGGDERDGFLDPNPLTATNVTVMTESLRDRTATYRTAATANAMVSLRSSTGETLSLRTYDPMTAGYEVDVHLGSILDLEDPTKLYMEIDLATHDACIVPQGQLEDLTPSVCRLDADATLHRLQAGSCQIKATLQGTPFSKVFDIDP